MIYLLYNRDSHLFRSVLRVSYVLFTRSEMRNVENVRRHDVSIYLFSTLEYRLPRARVAHTRGNARSIRSPTKIEIYTTAMGYITALYVYDVGPAHSRVYRQRLYREFRMVEL